MTMSRAYQSIGDFCRRFDLLPFAYALCFAAIVLTNDRTAPRTIYFVAVLPVAFVVGLAFARRLLTGSVVFWAVAVYLLAMGLASFGVPDIPWNEISRHLRLIPLILTYIAVVALLAADPRTFRRVLLLTCVIIAISALYNASVYIAYDGRLCPEIVSSERLCSRLGMPDYINSTNISAPYALYAVAAVGALLHSDTPRIERVLFAGSAAILLVALVLTEARSGFVAAALGCSVLAVTGRRWCRTAFAVTLLLIFVVVLSQPFLREALLQRGVSYRPELWAAYAAYGLGQPFTGVGILGNINMPMSDGYVVDQPHNLVLSGFVRGGVVGALAMATAIAAGTFYAARYWLATGYALPLALIVTMFGYGMLDYQLLATYPTWPWITFWFPIGVCAGVETVLKDPASLGAANAPA